MDSEGQGVVSPAPGGETTASTEEFQPLPRRQVVLTMSGVMLAMFLARKHTRAAYSEIGQYFGGRNHSTVISAERRVRHWLDDHSAISVACAPWPVAEVVESLEQQLLAG